MDDPSSVSANSPIVHFPTRRPLPAPIGPWYLEPTQAGQTEELCGVCRVLNLRWLLQNDLSSARSNGEKLATIARDDFCLPLGRLLDVLSRAESCAFCKLLIRTFTADFGREFQLLLDRASSVSPLDLDQDTSVGIRREFLGLANISLGPVESEPGALEILLQRSVPAISELDPKAAWLSLDTRPKDNGMVTLVKGDCSSYFIRVWLSATFDGRTVGSVLIHELSMTGKPNMGRRLTPQVDEALLQQWLDLGPQQLGPSAAQIPQKAMAHCMVVDVEGRRLVPMFAECKYAALSYVWGGSERNKTLNTKATFASLQVRGSICHDDPTLPTTIRDALDLCHRLKVEHLWVDSLCIVQDDAISRDIQVLHMDAIYQSAAFTIVVAAGSDADAGLPGLHLSRPRCLQQQAATIDGLSLISRPPRPSIQEEIWATRGWTFQEDYLSHRKLFFQANHVWFRISFGSESFDLEENTFPLPCSEVERLASIMQSRDTGTKRDVESRLGFPEYSSLVERYTSRRLSIPGDIIKAFSGLLRRLSAKYRTSFVQGLPVSILDISLLWLPKSDVTRRTESGSPVAPSWSWAGWVSNGVRYELYDPIHIGRITWKDAEIAKVSRESFPMPVSSDTDRLGHQQGNFQAMDLLDRDVLRFSALCAKFMLYGERVRLRDFLRAKVEYRGLRTYVVEDCEGNFAGAVCLHDPNVDPEYTMGSHIGPYELLAVARSGPATRDDQGLLQKPPPDDSDLREEACRPRSPESRPFEREYRDRYMDELRSQWGFDNDPYFFCQPFKRFYDYYNKNWSIYDVLVIEQKDGIAYRVGMGRCIAEAFWRNDAQRRSIQLA